MANYKKNGVAMNTLAGWSSSLSTAGYGNMGGFSSTASGACNFNYQGSDIITSVKVNYSTDYTSGSGTVSIPAGCIMLKFIVVSAGGGGGEGGYTTTGGGPGSSTVTDGTHGDPGCAGGYSTSYFTVTGSGATSYSYAIGAGGAGLAVNPYNSSGYYVYAPTPGGSSSITINGTSLTVSGGTNGSGIFSNTGAGFYRITYYPTTGPPYQSPDSSYSTTITRTGGSATSAISGLTFYGNTTGGAAVPTYSNNLTVPGNTTSNPPASPFAYISSYGSGGTGGAGQVGGSTPGAGGNGSGGFVRVYYIFN